VKQGKTATTGEKKKTFIDIQKKETKKQRREGKRADYENPEVTYQKKKKSTGTHNNGKK